MCVDWAYYAAVLAAKPEDGLSWIGPTREGSCSAEGVLEVRVRCDLGRIDAAAILAVFADMIVRGWLKGDHVDAGFSLVRACDTDAAHDAVLALSHWFMRPRTALLPVRCSSV